MEDKKEVIPYPDSGNCDFIHKSSSYEVINNFFNKKKSSSISFLPTTFSGLIYVDDIAREKNNKAIVSSGFLKRSSFVLVKTSIIVASMIAFITLVILGSMSIYFMFSQGSFLSHAVFFMISSGSFYSSFLIFSWLRKVDDRGTLTQKDFSRLENLISSGQRKELNSIEVIDLKHNANSDLRSIHNAFHKKVKSVMLLDKDTLNHVDLLYFAQKYDEYMRLYCFLVANDKVISQELMGEYIDKLERILDDVSKEHDTVMDLAEKYMRDIEKSEIERKELRQEMLDEDALRIVPVEDEWE